MGQLSLYSSQKWCREHARKEKCRVNRTFLRSQPTKWQWRVTPTRPQSVKFDQMSDSAVDGKGTIVTAVIDLPPNRVGRNTFRSRTPVSALRTAPNERFDLTLCCGVRVKG